MVPNTNFLRQVLKTVGASNEGKSGHKRERSPSASEDERARKRQKRDYRSASSDDKSSEERQLGPNPVRVMRGRGSSGSHVLDAVFGSESKQVKDKKHKKKHKKEKKKHKKQKKKDKRDKRTEKNYI